MKAFNIQLLADIRSYPGSKRFPHFNKEILEKTLPAEGIVYKPFPDLGGRRKAKKNSINSAWKNIAFRGYADYMQTAEFKSGINELEKNASVNVTAYMCSEAVWWRCHRSLVSDYLKWKGWEVLHILSGKKAEEHPYTSPAKIVNGQLTYSSSQQKLFE